MHPELITLPGGFTIKTYGFCLMVGFLTAVWFAMKRANRVKADPDVVLDLAFISLIFGVLGARIFFVIHYWKSTFAHAPNKLVAIFDITQGGLEFLGGFLGALVATVIYCALKKKENRISIRLYLDILAPSLMWGLAFGRLGCFFNGCCFGGVCITDQHDHNQKPVPKVWAVEFPFASPAHFKQWEDRKVTVPAELITTRQDMMLPALVAKTAIDMPVENRIGPMREYQELQQSLKVEMAKSPGSKQVKKLEARLAQAKKSINAQDIGVGQILLAQQYPSRKVPERNTSVTELTDLASQYYSLPVYPTQLYSVINAFLLSGVLTAIFYVRKRHGIVIGMIFVLYPIPRILLEIIRADNPLDVGGLTISQFVGLSMIVAGIAYLIFLYKYLPQRSPYAVVKPTQD